MIVRTDAVVLRSMRYRETSKIVTFYTRQFGKLAGVAKGARQTKNKFGASLEPMTEVHLVLYKKEQRDLQLVSQCDIVRSFKGLHSDMEKMESALSVIERLHQLTHDEEENPGLYRLLTETLDGIDRAGANVRNFVHAFELRLSALFGFPPVFDRCAVCGRSATEDQGPVTFRIDRGGLVCSGCADPSRVGRESATVRSSTVRILHRLLTARLDTLSSLAIQTSVRNELDETLRLYLQYHFEELRPLKTTGVFTSISGHR